MSTRKNYWNNPDGLTVGFGPRVTQVNVGTKTNIQGNEGEYVIDVVADKLVASGSLVVGDYDGAPKLPDGAIVTGVELFVEEVFAGSSGTLDVGTFGFVTGGDGTPNSITTIDADGVIDAEVITSKLDTLGKVTLTNSGAQIGASVDASGNSYFFAPSINSGTFTAGKAKVVVKYKQGAVAP